MMDHNRHHLEFFWITRTHIISFRFISFFVNRNNSHIFSLAPSFNHIALWARGMRVSERASVFVFLSQHSFIHSFKTFDGINFRNRTKAIYKPHEVNECRGTSSRYVLFEYDAHTHTLCLSSRVAKRAEYEWNGNWNWMRDERRKRDRVLLSSFVVVVVDLSLHSQLLLYLRYHIHFFC